MRAGRHHHRSRVANLSHRLRPFHCLAHCSG
jgi:hypothetical protein